MYGWMHGVCAYRDNLHSHQLLGLRSPPSTHHPCSGFIGSILFARNVTVAKSSWGAAMRTRHRRWRPGGRWCSAQGGSILSFHHKRCWKITFQPPAVALHWMHFDVMCESREILEAFNILVCVFDYRMSSQECSQRSPGLQKHGLRHLHNNGSNPISMWLQWKPRFQRKLILTLHSFSLTRRSRCISRQTTLTGKLVWVWMELVITVMVGSNVSLNIKGRNTLLNLRGKPGLMKTPFIQALQPPVRTASLSVSKGHVWLLNKKAIQSGKMSK